MSGPTTDPWLNHKLRQEDAEYRRRAAEAGVKIITPEEIGARAERSRLRERVEVMRADAERKRMEAGRRELPLNMQRQAGREEAYGKVLALLAEPGDRKTAEEAKADCTPTDLVRAMEKCIREGNSAEQMALCGVLWFQSNVSEGVRQDERDQVRQELLEAFHPYEMHSNQSVATAEVFVDALDSICPRGRRQEPSTEAPSRIPTKDPTT